MEKSKLNGTIEKRAKRGVKGVTRSPAYAPAQHRDVTVTKLRFRKRGWRRQNDLEAVDAHVASLGRGGIVGAVLCPAVELRGKAQV